MLVLLIRDTKGATIEQNNFQLSIDILTILRYNKYS